MTTPLREHLLGNVRLPLLLLQGAVLMVLLTACANAGGLLLARGVRRREETAVRLSLGAGHGRVGGALLLEGVVLGAGAGALGLLGAWVLLRPALSLVPPGLPRVDTVHMDPSIAVFAVALAVFTGGLAALVPALAGSATPPATLLRAASGSGAAPWLTRILDGFVVGQVALAVLLSVGAALLLRSFVATVREDPGFDPTHVTVLDIQLPEVRYPDGASRIAFARVLLDRASELPGVTAVAVGRNLPISGSNMTSPLAVEGSEKASDAVQVAQVSAGYFEVLRIPLVDGSGFDEADREGGAPVLVVNTEVHSSRGVPLHVGDRAHSFFGPDGYREVVGVAGAVRHEGLRSSPSPVAYEPFFQKQGAPRFTLLVRARGSAERVAAAAQDLVRALDPALPVESVGTMDERISASLAESRFYTVTLSVFGFLALLLALSGCQAALAHRVAARRREVGVRMALGASPPQVREMVVVRGLGTTVLGVVLGLAAAIPAARVLQTQLYGVTVGDPWTYVGILVLFAAAGALASDGPARRASSTDPVKVLQAG